MRDNSTNKQVCHFTATFAMTINETPSQLFTNLPINTPYTATLVETK